MSEEVKLAEDVGDLAADKAVAKLDEKPELNSIEQAALLIHEANKNFGTIVHNLAQRKKQALGRVLQAVLFEPLEEVKLFGKEEEELYSLCKNILFNKGLIMNYTIEKQRTKQGETNVTEK